MIATSQVLRVGRHSVGERTSWSTGLSVTADGVGLVAHAGGIATRLLGDRTGLTAELSRAMSRRRFTPVHDRGRVLVDVAVMLADGGEAIADIDVLRHQAGVLGPVASPATVWRTLKAMTPGPLKKIAAARARVRRHVWAQLPDGVPASKVAGTDLGDVIVLDIDATIVVTHSEKAKAAATFKRTFGYHPLGVWCDNTEEFLAAKLRAGNAGSTTTADHIEVFTDAIAQVPGTHRRKLLIRSDGAGAHPTGCWTGSPNKARSAAGASNTRWGSRSPRNSPRHHRPAQYGAEEGLDPAIDADGGVRDGGDVAELTGLLNLAKWPKGMRVIVRRERPHPGAQLSLFEERDGWRHQAFVTNTASGQLAFPKPVTGHTPASRTGSATPRTLAWAGPHPASSTSTRHG